MTLKRDHGGGVDAAIEMWGGRRDEWLDLSTGINPVPYPIGAISAPAWNDLPDQRTLSELERAARSFWNVPQEAAVLAANGASALIARMPEIAQDGAYIPGPTYNEHAAAFRQMGKTVSDGDRSLQTHIYVHPNNPDGRVVDAGVLQNRRLTIIDESFCDVTPALSLIEHSSKKGVLILKSFGKFWGLAGLRLGFVIGDPELVASLRERLGPWSVSGPALEIGARALCDHEWAGRTRERLAEDAARLDALMSANGATPLGGTTLFRLYDTESAEGWRNHLAKGKVLSRIFPYSSRWVRLGLPHPDRWTQLEDAL